MGLVTMMVMIMEEKQKKEKKKKKTTVTGNNNVWRRCGKYCLYQVQVSIVLYLRWYSMVRQGQKSKRGREGTPYGTVGWKQVL